MLDGSDDGEPSEARRTTGELALPEQEPQDVVRESKRVRAVQREGASNVISLNTTKLDLLSEQCRQYRTLQFDSE